MADVDPELVAAVKTKVEKARHALTPESIKDAEDIVKDATDPNELAEAAAAAQAPAGTSPPAAAVLPIPASAVANNPDGAIHLAKLLAFSKSKKDRRKGIAIFHQVFASGYSTSDSRFWAAMAHLESGQIRSGRVLIEKLALEEPTNKDAEGAIGLVKELLETQGVEGWKTVALYAGAAIAVIGFGIWLWKQRSSSSSTSSAGRASAEDIESVVRAASAVSAPPLPALATSSISSAAASAPAASGGFQKPAYGNRFKH